MPAVRTETVVVSRPEAGTRLDKLLAAHLPEVSRSYIQKLIEDGHIQTGSQPRRGSYKVREGEDICVTIPEPEALELAAEPIDLAIVYEDCDIMVVDKPAGLVVHPAPGHASGTLVNAVLAHCPDLSINGSIRPGIVHRLDKDTSGLLAVAKTDRGMSSFVEQMKNHEVLKEYLALVDGIPDPPEAVIEGPIGRNLADRKRMDIVPGGRPATTKYRVIERFEHNALLLVRIYTGRTHQIRVHLSHVGHPVTGDPVYGKRQSSLKISRPFLHAAKLGFRLPATGEYREFTAVLPPELKNTLSELRGESVVQH
jgi:23S rRNA pseudouridine1911/1915/1917 synthase